MNLSRISLFLAIVSCCSVFGSCLAYLLGLADNTTVAYVAILSIVGVVLFVILAIQFHHRAMKKHYEHTQESHTMSNDTRNEILASSDACPICNRTNDEIFDACDECGYNPYSKG